MPILGVYTKDPIYNKAIREALDVDRKADLRAFNYSKNQIARFDALETPQQQTTQPTISELNTGLINKLKISLDAKFVQLQKINYIFQSSSNTSYNIQKLDEVDRVNQSEPDIITFNSIIGIIKNNAVNGSEKKLISNELHLLITPLNKLINMFKEVLKFLLTETGDAEVNVNALFLSTYAVYKTMLDSIENNEFDYITDTTVKQTYTKMINEEFANYVKGRKEFKETAKNKEYEKTIEDLEDKGYKLSDTDIEKIKNMFKGHLLYNPKYPENLGSLLKDFTNKNIREQIISDAWKKEIGAMATGIPPTPTATPAVIAEAEKVVSESDEDEPEAEAKAKAEAEAEAPVPVVSTPVVPDTEEAKPEEAKPAGAKKRTVKAKPVVNPQDVHFDKEDENPNAEFEAMTQSAEKYADKLNESKEKIKEYNNQKSELTGQYREASNKLEKITSKTKKTKKDKEAEISLKAKMEDLSSTYDEVDYKLVQEEKNLKKIKNKIIKEANKKTGNGLYSVVPKEDYYNPDDNDYYSLRF